MALLSRSLGADLRNWWGGSSGASVPLASRGVSPSKPTWARRRRWHAERPSHYSLPTVDDRLPSNGDCDTKRSLRLLQTGNAVSYGYGFSRFGANCTGVAARRAA